MERKKIGKKENVEIKKENKEIRKKERK